MGEMRRRIDEIEFGLEVCPSPLLLIFQVLIGLQLDDILADDSTCAAVIDGRRNDLESDGLAKSDRKRTPDERLHSFTSQSSASSRILRGGD